MPGMASPCKGLFSLDSGLSLTGVCRTPCYGRVYDALPEESRTARVQLLRPAREDQRRACVLHLAATGEHAFKQRLRLGEPLLAQVCSP